jgi:hypothetical protein
MFVLPAGLGLLKPPPVVAAEHLDVALYTGNGSFPRNIPVLADPRDGFVLQRKRGVGSGFTNHVLPNSGAYKYVQTNNFFSAPQAVASVTLNAASIDITANADLGSVANVSSDTYAWWILAKQAGILDVVNYTGNGANRTIAHALGAVPGAIVIRKLGGSGNTRVGHRSLMSYLNYLNLDSAALPAAGAAIFNSTDPTSTHFSLGTDNSVNQNGIDYVAYIFGHDTGAGGKIQCDSYVGNGSITGPIVNLGWDPRALIIKRTTVANSSWQVLDQFRSPGFTGTDLRFHTDSATADGSVGFVALTGTGFQRTNNDATINGAANTYIYIAIR